jgi:hypothetical protein
MLIDLEGDRLARRAHSAILDTPPTLQRRSAVLPLPGREAGRGCSVQ